MSFINEGHYNVICGGDFNINMFSDSATKKEMESLVGVHGCINTITNPTRITLHSTTVLDLFITNYHLDRVKSGVISCDQ